MAIATTFSQLSTISRGDLVLGVVLALFFGFVGYRASERFHVVVGVTPWRIPSIIWGAICFFLQPFGIVLQWIAEFTTRPSSTVGRRAPASTGATPPPPPYGQFGRPQVPLPGAPNPYPPGTGPLGVATTPTPPPVGFAPPLDPAGRVALFGWYPDPTGRHERRYFDGRHWSDLVEDGTARGEDSIRP